MQPLIIGVVVVLIFIIIGIAYYFYASKRVDVVKEGETKADVGKAAPVIVKDATTPVFTRDVGITSTNTGVKNTSVIIANTPPPLTEPDTKNYYCYVFDGK